MKRQRHLQWKGGKKLRVFTDHAFSDLFREVSEEDICQGQEKKGGVCKTYRLGWPPPEDAGCVGRAGAGRVGVGEDSRLREGGNYASTTAWRVKPEKGSGGASGKRRRPWRSV